MRSRQPEVRCDIARLKWETRDACAATQCQHAISSKGLTHQSSHRDLLRQDRGPRSNLAPPTDPLATATDRTCLPQSATPLPEIERDRPGTLRHGVKANATTLTVRATTFRSDETALAPSQQHRASVATTFSARAIVGMPDASSAARPARAGCVAVLSLVKHHHQCRDARPSSGRSSRSMYERRITEEDRDGEACAGVQPRAPRHRAGHCHRDDQAGAAGGPGGGHRDGAAQRADPGACGVGAEGRAPARDAGGTDRAPGRGGPGGGAGGARAGEDVPVQAGGVHLPRVPDRGAGHGELGRRRIGRCSPSTAWRSRCWTSSSRCWTSSTRRSRWGSKAGPRTSAPRGSSGRWPRRSCGPCESWMAGTGSGSPPMGSCWGAGSAPVRCWVLHGLVRSRKERHRQAGR